MRIRRPVEWRDIPSYEGRYAITRDGRVWSHGGSFANQYNKPRWLSRSISNNGYPIVILQKGPRQKRTFLVHRLVILVWGPPQPSPKHECNHRNGIKTDASIGNLEWVLRWENFQHAMTTGLMHARFTAADIIQIRQRHADGERAAELAREFNVDHSVIGKIVRRERWKHL